MTGPFIQQNNSSHKSKNKHGDQKCDWYVTINSEIYIASDENKKINNKYNMDKSQKITLFHKHVKIWD